MTSSQQTTRKSLEGRLVVGVLYLGALIGLAIWAHRDWPPASGAGLWFYTAAIAVLLAVFVSEPFYTSPKTALASSAALFLVVLTADSDGLEASHHAISVGRTALLALAGLVFSLAAIALTTRGRAPRVNAIAYPLSVTFGAGYLLYGVTYVASVYGAFALSPRRLAVLLAAALVFAWRPLERLATVMLRVQISKPPLS